MVSTSIVRKRLLEVGPKATRSRRKQFLTPKMMETVLDWIKKSTMDCERLVQQTSKKMFWNFFRNKWHWKFSFCSKHDAFCQILRSRTAQFMETFDRAFQQDLALCHNSKFVQTFTFGNKTRVFD
ncbi:hypothetical protein TNCV_4297021 [Trichonephila clavipes]|nr:hypothetical protein TNCV_4297021 [Trichonephila clavipes]